MQTDSPLDTQTTTPFAPVPDAAVDTVRQARQARQAKRVRRFEGIRGQATRQAIILRYCAAMAAIVLCAGVNKAGLAHITSAAGGWKLLIGAVAVEAVIAAAGTFAFPARRDEIVQQTRHYIFGLTLFPATGLSGLMWALKPFADTAGPAGDGALTTVNTALPYIYYLPIIIAPIVFAKVISGIAGFHRVATDDEEMMLTLTRQDGLQR